MSELEIDRLKHRINTANARAARPAYYRRKNREYQRAWRERQKQKSNI